MKEKLGRFKEKYKICQKTVLDTNRRMIVLNSNKASKDEALRFVNLMFEKSYGEGYLLSFLDCINEQPEIATRKYENILKQVNEHLVKIVEEYKQLTDELDAIIFKGEEVV